jgi:glucans biosynthesis protein
MKTTNNPMNQARVEAQLTQLRAADRCGAKTRAGRTCQCPAIRGRNRCRLHGGRSTGAPRGSGNGNFTTGEFTAEAIQEREWIRSIVRAYGKVELS